MKAEKILNHKAEDIFNSLIDFVCKDLEFNGYNEFNKSDIKKGLKYRKKIWYKNKYIFNNAEITEFIENKSLETSVYTSRGDYIISYNLEKIDDNSVKFIYEEKFNSDSFFNKINQKLMEFLLRKKLNNKLDGLLDAIIKNIN
ncbi:DUF3284 domain-containing protein [uncultured Helcococcus sp.]|uniref:DUF3284 domain-containing protein n=1 Tax=uncultured Helcococcus sp. TaxID=1072508 RepID=UPI00262046C0|nr:DUF3284 domain-containing protein [uncultured Helcococcus sp.]